jgi:hypothetical protein
MSTTSQTSQTAQATSIIAQTSDEQLTCENSRRAMFDSGQAGFVRTRARSSVANMTFHRT